MCFCESSSIWFTFMHEHLAIKAVVVFVLTVSSWYDMYLAWSKLRNESLAGVSISYPRELAIPSLRTKKMIVIKPRTFAHMYICSCYLS